MIASWMVYVLLVSAALAAVAALAERIATVQRWPRRGIWIAAILATAVLVVVSRRRVASITADLARHAAVARTEARTTGTFVPLEPKTTAKETGSSSALVRWRAISERIQLPLAMLWLAGTVGVGLLFAGGALVMARRRLSWNRGMIDGVEVLVAAKDGPAVAGLFQPVIVIPEWATAIPDESRRLMLRHEQEHIRARDPWITHAAALAVLALPWNLPLWWMLSRLRLALEVDCDARVIGAHKATPAPAARRYGELLLEVATRRSRKLVAAPALLEQSSALGRRIVAMHPRAPRFPRLHNVALGAAALGLTAFAGLRQPPAPPPARGLAAPPGWVMAESLREPIRVSLERPGASLRRLFPELDRQLTPSVIMIARDVDGAFMRAARGDAVMGPLRERLPVGGAGPLERLLQARTAADWRAADRALFGNIPAGDSVRAEIALPLRLGSRSSALAAYRIPAGEAGPKVVYLFVVTEVNR